MSDPLNYEALWKRATREAAHQSELMFPPGPARECAFHEIRSRTYEDMITLPQQRRRASRDATPSTA